MAAWDVRVLRARATRIQKQNFSLGFRVQGLGFRGSQIDGEAIDPKGFQATLQLLELLKPH